MLPLAIAGAVVGALVVAAVRRRGTLRRQVERRGWGYRERDDELASTWTMPPFARLASPSYPDPPETGWTRAIEEVVTFTVAGSVAHSLVMTETLTTGNGKTSSTTHVVALHSRQGLPRTIVRAGIDVYVLPAYEGLDRVLEPKHSTRGGVLAVLSEDRDAVRDWPLDRVAGDLDLDRQLHLVTDGDWIYAYRRGGATMWQLERMLVTIQKLARGIRPVRWPGPDEPSTYTYGAI